MTAACRGSTLPESRAQRTAPRRPPASPARGSRTTISYTGAMRSVADLLRQADREAVAELSPEARIALALELGDADLETLQHARGIDRAEAVRVFQRQRQAGRTLSACMRAVIG